MHSRNRKSLVHTPKLGLTYQTRRLDLFNQECVDVNNNCGLLPKWMLFFFWMVYIILKTVNHVFFDDNNRIPRKWWFKNNRYLSPSFYHLMESEMIYLLYTWYGMVSPFAMTWSLFLSVKPIPNQSIQYQVIISISYMKMVKS